MTVLRWRLQEGKQLISSLKEIKYLNIFLHLTEQAQTTYLFLPYLYLQGSMFLLYFCKTTFFMVKITSLLNVTINLDGLLSK